MLFFVYMYLLLFASYSKKKEQMKIIGAEKNINEPIENVVFHCKNDQIDEIHIINLKQ